MGDVLSKKFECVIPVDDIANYSTCTCCGQHMLVAITVLNDLGVISTVFLCMHVVLYM